MKKVLLIAMAISLLVAGMAMATVVSSKHDLRAVLDGKAGMSGTKASAYAGTQVCVFCHHPHRGSGTGAVQNALLWNVSNDLGVVGWSTYSNPGSTNSSDMGGLMSDAGQNITKACLSCHDGVIGIGSVVKQPIDGDVTAGDTMTPGARLDTTTFEDDHPVDFTYPISAAAGGLEDIELAVDGEVDGKYPLINGRMQCSTCHDVHDPGSGSVQFLRGSIADSEMCIDCHTSK